MTIASETIKKERREKCDNGGGMVVKEDMYRSEPKIVELFLVIKVNYEKIIWIGISVFRDKSLYKSSSSDQTSSPRLRRSIRSFFFFRSSLEVSLTFLTVLTVLPVAST